MSEPQTKRRHYDQIHMRLREEEGLVQTTFSYTFLPCNEDQCRDHGFFSDKRTHKLLSIELPGMQCRPAPSPEPQVHLACKRWVDEWNTVTRFIKANIWWALCRLLVERYPELWPVRHALRVFGEEYLVIPALRVLDDKYGITVDCLPHAVLRDEQVNPGEGTTTEHDGQ